MSEAPRRCQITDLACPPLDALGPCRRRIVGAWACFFAWSALVWVLSTRPFVLRTHSSTLDHIVSQASHLVGHFLLGLAAWRSSALTWGPSHALWVALSITVPHAVLDELVQEVIPTRNANFEDVAFNLAGTLLALLGTEYLRRRSNRVFVSPTLR